MTESKDMLVSDELSNELDASFGDARTFFHGLERYRDHLRKWRTMAIAQESEVSRLRAELDEALGALNDVLAGAPWHSIDRTALAKARELLSKHSKEGQEVTG